MKETLRITSYILTFSIISTSIGVLAKSKPHKIGFIKPIECARSYWIFSKKHVRNENEIIAQSCFNQVSKEAKISMNIDGSSFTLNRIKKDDKGNKILSTYQSDEFTVQENVAEISGCNNRENSGVSILSGTIIITSNKGWKKVIPVTGIWDNCG
jgi:hypothetical protein